MPACFDCNIAKGDRTLVPEGYERLSELRELPMKGVWMEWDGDPKAKAFTELLIK